MASPRQIVQPFVHRIEEMECLDGVARPLAAGTGRLTRATPVKNALSGTWFGHPLRPVLTDLPIGAWTMAAVLDVAGGSPSAGAARRLVGTGAVAALPAAAAGWADWSDTYGADQRVGLVHALGNLAATFLQMGSYLCRRRGHRGAGVALSAVALGAVTVTGYLGGHLSYIRGVGVNHTAFEEPATDWVDVASLDDLPPDGRPLRALAKGVPLMLVRHAGEDVVALSATCTHAGGPLDEGKMLDGSVRCPRHGSVFRLADGKVLRGPASTTQPVWKARIQGERVEVRSGR